MTEKLTFEEQAVMLRAYPANEVIISRYRSVPEVLSAYILARCGAILSDEILYHPEVWMGREMSSDVRDRALLLNRKETWHPEVLRLTIAKAREAGQINGIEREFLAHLLGTLEHYRAFPESRWFEGRDHILTPRYKGTRTQLNLHNYLAALMDANFDNPQRCFAKGIEALRRLENNPRGLETLNPIKMGVPILKNPVEEPVDEVDFAEFEFDRVRAVYLPNVSYRIVVGGVPDSGKSTFTASLCATMKELRSLCERDGILDEGELKLEVFNLDTISPTVHTVMSGGITGNKEPYRNPKKHWDFGKAEKVRRTFMDLSQGVNIALGDLPGGGPDFITEILASSADFSILVNRSIGDEAKDWRNFLLGLGGHSNIVRVHTRFREPNRQSGVREYESISQGARRDLLWGRVVDLDRALRVDDPFIGFAAHVLFFDYLPGAMINDNALHSKLRLSLR